MKPAAFAYHDPESLEEVLELLAVHGDEAAILAGGQSLVPLMNLRLARPAVVIDLRRVGGLDDLVVDTHGLTAGARVTATRVERHRGTDAGWTAVRQALRTVAHPQIRHRTTICGSLAHADPTVELPAVALGLEATITLQSRDRGARTVAAGDYFGGPFLTAGAPDEVVTRVHLPRWDGPSAWLEVAPRAGSFPLVGVLVAVRLDPRPPGDRGPATIAVARVAGCGLADRPVRLDSVEAALAGASLGPDLPAIGAAATAALDPPSDDHASGAYRAAVAGTLVARALAGFTGAAPPDGAGRADAAPLAPAAAG